MELPSVESGVRMHLGSVSRSTLLLCLKNAVINIVVAVDSSMRSIEMVRMSIESDLV